MNITGVTQTAPVLPVNQPAYQPQAAQQTRVQSQESSDGMIRGADVISASVTASIKVMDLAQNSFEDAANQLIAEMAAVTGIGQNVDMTV